MFKITKISDNAYRGLFIGFIISGFVMLFMIRSFSSLNAILMGKEFAEILGQIVTLAITFLLPITIAATVKINELSTTRIAVGSLILLHISTCALIIFFTRYDAKTIGVETMVDFYTIIFFFVSSLTMLVAKIFN